MFHAAKIYDSINVQNNEETNMGGLLFLGVTLLTGRFF